MPTIKPETAFTSIAAVCSAGVDLSGPDLLRGRCSRLDRHFSRAFFAALKVRHVILTVATGCERSAGLLQRSGAAISCLYNAGLRRGYMASGRESPDDNRRDRTLKIASEHLAPFVVLRRRAVTNMILLGGAFSASVSSSNTIKRIFGICASVVWRKTPPYICTTVARHQPANLTTNRSAARGSRLWAGRPIYQQSRHLSDHLPRRCDALPVPLNSDSVPVLEGDGFSSENRY